MRARGLGPRGGGTVLAIAICSVLPSETYDAVGPPKSFCFRGSIPGPHVPLSTLRPCPHGQRRMTRGQCGSLLLHHAGLAPALLTGLCRRTVGSKYCNVHSQPTLPTWTSTGPGLKQTSSPLDTDSSQTCATHERRRSHGLEEAAGVDLWLGRRGSAPEKRVPGHGKSHSPRPDQRPPEAHRQRAKDAGGDRQETR